MSRKAIITLLGIKRIGLENVSGLVEGDKDSIKGN